MQQAIPEKKSQQELAREYCEIIHAALYTRCKYFPYALIINEKT